MYEIPYFIIFSFSALLFLIIKSIKEDELQFENDLLVKLIPFSNKSFSNCIKSHRPIHGSGLEERQSETLCNGQADRRFADTRRPVDGHDDRCSPHLRAPPFERSASTSVGERNR